MTWQKGQSGNPAGRASARPITLAILAELKKPQAKDGARTKLEGVAVRLVNLILYGPPSEAVAAFKVLAGYTDGLPTQPVDVTGEVDHTVTVQAIREAIGLVERSA